MRFKLFAIFCLITSATVAFTGESPVKIYIDTYKDVAIREMKTYGIPASITLAQGILESGSGQSRLAQKGNNHFGIKCHLDWNGKKIYEDDDKKHECFRAYKNPEESFRDHSLFLVNRSRYAFLFDEKPTDYKAWAKGLKKAGYATNPKYPSLLINLIERHELYKYDVANYKPSKRKKEKVYPVAFPSAPLANVSTNGIKYVYVGAGDTYESIAEATENRVRDLLKYNELESEVPLVEGQIIYLQPKRKKAARKIKSYTVKSGDNLYGISQKFGIKLKYLCEMNGLGKNDSVSEGTVLKLR